mgnify:CR=1 FL=1
MRIFAISDLHTDFQENWLFLKEIFNKQQNLRFFERDATKVISLNNYL